MEKRVISTDLMEEDYKIENSLRPKFLKDYIGQSKAKENLKKKLKTSVRQAVTPYGSLLSWRLAKHKGNR